jgi:hypothetical protein
VIRQTHYVLMSAILAFAQTASAQSNVAPKLTVGVEASITGGSRPFVRGRTNLPAGLELQVSLAAPAPACSPTCAYQWLIARVAPDGRFEAGPFDSSTSLLGVRNSGLPRDLPPGVYRIEITTAMFDRNTPRNVVDALGQNGEKIAGPLAFSLIPGDTTIKYTKQVQITP